MKALIVANWKMNPKTSAEAKALFNSIKNSLKKHSNILKNVGIIICPPFVYLPILRNQMSKFKLGAQDCFWENSGAFTGEVSPQMLKDLGCQYVIIGHSERRRYFGEKDEMINRKIKTAILAKLKPILCIGETEKERRERKTKEVLKNQLKEALKSISNFKFQISNLIIAYEPIWAIGTGMACGIKEARAINLFIKKFFKNIPLLYGGSVNSQNAKDYILKAKYQGLLVGGASLNPKEFIKIVENLS